MGKDARLERIVCSAIKVFGAGKELDGIYLGLRHADCFKTMGDFRKLLPQFSREEARIRMLRYSEQGFLTTNNVFVDRKVAFVIATKRGQIIKKHGTKDELYSEDIY